MEVTIQDQSPLWSSLLADLKALYDAYYAAHWRSKGGDYYGDHLLFQRLYGDLVVEIDGVAERALGITNNDNIVEPSKLVADELGALKSLVPQGDSAQAMLSAEKKFLAKLGLMRKTLEQAGQLSDGVDNLLQGIADKHEEHVYLLSRRVKTDDQNATVLRAFVRESLQLEKKKKKKKRSKEQRFWYAGGPISSGPGGSGFGSSGGSSMGGD